MIAHSASLALAVSLALAAGDPGQGDGKRLDRLFDGEVGAVEALPGLSAQRSGRLVASTAVDTTAIPTVRLYRVRRPSGEEVTVCALDVELKGKRRRLLAGVGPNGAVVGPMLFDDHGDPVRDADEFLAQFRPPRGLGLTEASAEPVGEVIRLRDRFVEEDEPPKKKQDRARWALLRHHVAMLSAAGRLARAMRSVDDPPTVRRLLDDLEQIGQYQHELAGSFGGFLEPRDIGTYRKLAAEFREAVAKAKQAVAAGDPDRIRQALRRDVKRACGRCHGYDRNSARQSFQDLIGAERGRAGWKNGVFVVGVDVAPSDGPLLPEEQQRLASAVKAALLLASGRL